MALPIGRRRKLVLKAFSQVALKIVRESHKKSLETDQAYDNKSLVLQTACLGCSAKIKQCVFSHSTPTHTEMDE